MARWYHLCQQCWEGEHAGQYLPDEAIDYGLCDGCGDNTLVYGSRTLPSEPMKGFHIDVADCDTTHQAPQGERT